MMKSIHSLKLTMSRYIRKNVHPESTGMHGSASHPYMIQKTKKKLRRSLNLTHLKMIKIEWRKMKESSLNSMEVTTCFMKSTISSLL